MPKIAKRMLQSLANALGYEIRRLRPIDREDGFELYRYRKPDGTFDYERYRQVQTAGNNRKLDQSWAVEENISFLSEYVKKTVSSPSFGLCHGTRRGKEQEWFGKYLGCEVLGTELSDTAEQFPHTIRWDFHEVKPEWLGAVDFIYSNAFDHSYDPVECLRAWMSCVSEGGVCILEHSSGHERASELDPFGAPVTQMPYLIATWGAGEFSVREILDAPVKPESLLYMKYLVIQKL